MCGLNDIGKKARRISDSGLGWRYLSYLARDICWRLRIYEGLKIGVDALMGAAYRMHSSISANLGLKLFANRRDDFINGFVDSIDGMGVFLYHRNSL